MAVLASAGLALSCAGARVREGSVEAGGAREVTVRFATDHVAQRVSPGFLSVAVDAAQVVGAGFWSRGAGEYDFTRPRLRRLARELAPGYLRVGGSDADTLYYDMGDRPRDRAPAPYRHVLARAHWEAMHEFARTLGFELMFTLNAGPGPRDGTGAWTPDNARELIAYARTRGHRVALWELGNEINGFQAIHGLTFRVSGATYARDVARARALLDEASPGARLAGPSSAFWPVAGELFAVMPEFLAAGGGAHLDVLTWHYYPQQSHRCAIATRRASVEHMYDPYALNEVLRWAHRVERAARTHAPRSEVWLGETGSAQCGGEPRLSDTFASGFWWLDELGLMARRGQQVVVRQSLSGSDYGLLSEPALVPRPDYWSSVLWRRLMGPEVLHGRVEPSRSTVRAYAHCTHLGAREHAPGSVTVLLLNLDRGRGATVNLAGLRGRAEVYALTAPTAESIELRLNGVALRAQDDGSLPALEPRIVPEEPTGEAPRIELAPASYAFVVLPEAQATGCR